MGTPKGLDILSPPDICVSRQRLMRRIGAYSLLSSNNIINTNMTSIPDEYTALQDKTIPIWIFVSINSILSPPSFLSKCFRYIWQNMRRGMRVFCLKCNRRFPSLCSPPAHPSPCLNMLMNRAAILCLICILRLQQRQTQIFLLSLWF